MIATASKPKVSAEWRKLLKLLPGYDCFKTAKPGMWFDEEAADKAVEFFGTCLTHIEGELSGCPFTLQPWQQAVIGCMFGWKRKHHRTGRTIRRYREVLLFIPRKNGKTPLAAGIANMVMFCDQEQGAQGYLFAGAKEQAALAFRQMKGQINNEPELSSRCTIYGKDAGTQKRIVYHETGGFIVVQSADDETQHGGNTHLALVDELHVQKTRDLIDTIRTSLASENRVQPLIVMITTSDFDRPSICNEVHDYASKVRDGVIDDAAFLPVIYEATNKDDWKSPKTWRKANPNLGVSVSEEYLERECKRAQEEPTYENTFKRLHLNIRTQTDVRWLQLDAWDKCAGVVDEASLIGRQGFGALDLSTKLDITSFVMVFPPNEADKLWRVLARFWIPEEGAVQRERKDRVPYVTWAKQGLIEMTSGNVVDYEAIKAKVIDDGQRFNLQEIAYDPWNATQIALQLTDSGATMVEFGQGFKSMSEPAKELEKLVVSGMLAHGGNPVLRWMASNAAAEIDPAGNIKPSKKKSTERIDGIVSLTMAIGRAMLNRESVYDTGGLKWI